MNQLISHPLLAIRDCAVLLRNKLEEAQAVELPNYRPYLDDQIKSIDEALALAKIPDHYRVAIVGRFKVGKSSFVNKLTDERLTGVETSPETAAISLLRYAENTYAEVKFISIEEWEELRATYEADPTDPEVKRYSGFAKFNERPPKRDKDGPPVHHPKIDLKALAAKWLRSGGYTHRIQPGSWKTKEDKNSFRREIKKFTSSQEPVHYLVDRLIVYAPIPLLGDNIELIDTPGLDDTERFRVRLTENHGVKFDWSRFERLHDREVIFSNGWVVKVGRGLDIYYPPESWASVGASNCNLRKCRQTKVDVFRRDQSSRAH